MQPPVLNIKEIAIFLDFDGTLVDFAHRPEAVFVSPDLKSLLQRLDTSLGGALALVTGRSLESLDALVGNPALCAAGCHGAEWRTLEVKESAANSQSSSLPGAHSLLASFADQHDLLLEEKPYSLALHFRNRPELAATIDAWVLDNLANLSDLRIINGKCVREVQLAGMHKGTAVKRFMQHAPFAGKVPVYLGDDVTDEDAFAWVNENEGISVKIGEGDTIAKYRLPDHSAVYAWLEGLL